MVFFFTAVATRTDSHSSTVTISQILNSSTTIDVSGAACRGWTGTLHSSRRQCFGRDPDGFGIPPSHAAVVARQTGRVCRVCCPDPAIETQKQTVLPGRTTLHKEKIISIDGTAGLPIPARPGSSGTCRMTSRRD